MAIDFGTRRVGIAVTDPLQIIASPVKTIAPENLSGFIKEYTASEVVEQIVLGYPLKEDGTPTDLTAAVDKLLDKLKIDFPAISFCKHDERYTSKLAQKSMVQSGARKKSRREKSNLDQISATLILQSFMEKKKWAQ